MENRTNSPANFETLFFRRVVVPGIIIELILAFIICVPTGINLNLLNRPIGGPPGIAIQAGMIPCMILALAYIAVACVYTIILPYKYCKLSISFLGSVRRFLIFSILTFSMLGFIAIVGWVEFIRWDYVYILNLPVVLSLTGFVFMMTGLFLYWTIRVYRQQQIRFFSWKTVEGLGLFLTAVALVCVALFLLI